MMIGITGGPQISLHVMIRIIRGPQVQEKMVAVDLMKGTVHKAGQGVQGRTVEVHMMKEGVHQAGQGVQGARVAVLRGPVHDPTVLGDADDAAAACAADWCPVHDFTAKCSWHMMILDRYMW